MNSDLDHGQSWMEWNHDDFTEVGGSSVITIHVHNFFLVRLM